ncbi:MAG TPA: hypothetical protein VJN96_18170 [Vicinamibacterales bacterium]|nr:hypothetical protein [Vicinamibacterales bacterium]
METSPRAAVVAYYQDPRIRARLNEYLTDERGEVSAVYVAGFDSSAQPYPTWSDASIVAAAQLEALTLRGYDVARSLWDRTALIFLLDLDYQNLDYPGEPFTHATDTFFKLEKAYQSCCRVFNELGLTPLVTATGRGYHFVGRIPLDQPVADRLAGLTATPSWYDGHVRRCRSAGTAPMSTWHARAAAGLGLVLEYVAQLILKDAEQASLVPVVLNGTPVGSGFIGRECVSVDISHAGDPLDARHVRMAFSTYQFHLARPDIFGPAVANGPVVVAMPREPLSLEAFLRAGRSLTDGLEASATARSVLPDISRGVDALLERYVRSPLGSFHATFTRECGAMLDEPWPEIPDGLPPCIRRPLDQPNDLLLKPEYLQDLVRGLMARDWSAAAIARLVEREYARDHHWSDRWRRLDARTRAEFDVRVFAGLLVTGADRLIDFNCTSSQEKGVCPRCGCPHDLREDRDRLMTKFTS